MSRHPRVRSVAAPLIAAAVIWFGGVAPASADHQPARLGLTPVGHDGTYFSLTMDAGEARKLQVEAANFGHTKIVARTYAADAYSIVNGGFGADLFGERSSGPTRWLTYPVREATLGPADAIVIDFDVTVPADTPPGEYVTAVVIENAEPVPGSGTIAVDQVNRNAIAIAIEIPGPQRPELSIGSVHHQEVAGFSVVSFDVDNPGNLHLRPAGDFVLRSDDGTQVAAHAVVMDSIYAGTTTSLEAPALEPLAPGDYCAQLSLTDSRTGARDATECLPFTIAESDGAPFGGLPDAAARAAATLADWLPGPMAAIPLVLGAGGLLILIARRRRSRVRSAAATTTGWAAQPGLPTAYEGPENALSRLIAPLRNVLDEHPEIARGWVIRRHSELMLAVEGPRGATPAEASRLSMSLQERVEKLRPSVPMQVICLQGAGPVARVTGGAAPFYDRTRQR